MAPPPAVSPDDHFPEGFRFDRFGVRVPAVLVSPWIPPGSVIRPNGETPFDHTSILATLRALFGIETLTNRDAVAPDVLHALSLPEPTNTGPTHLPLPALPPTPRAIIEAAETPPNQMQLALAQFANMLPSGSAKVADTLALGEITARVLSREVVQTTGDALATAEKGLSRFLRGAGAAT